MKLDQVCNKNDEYYTPDYAIEPILEYIEPNSIIWCPFDQKHSNYVKVLSKEGHIVINSHLDDGGDFFKYFPKEHIQYIISNPPYSLKYEVFKRLFDLSIPFAMLVGLDGIFGSKNRFNLFANNSFEVLYFDKRIEFYSRGMVCNPPFAIGYITSQF